MVLEPTNSKKYAREIGSSDPTRGINKHVSNHLRDAVSNTTLDPRLLIEVEQLGLAAHGSKETDPTREHCHLLFTTSPKFNSVPLKNGGWKTILSYWEGKFFKGEPLNFGGYLQISLFQGGIDFEKTCSLNYLLLPILCLNSITVFSTEHNTTALICNNCGETCRELREHARKSWGCPHNDSNIFIYC